MPYARIAKSSRYLPEFAVSNDDLSRIMETSDDWIKTRTGISSRRISQQENTSDLAIQVAKQLLAGEDPAEVDLIIVATMSPDAYTPATAALVQAAVGAENAACFDLSAACSGFVYALDVAEKMLTRPDGLALVIGAETLSKLVDWQDRATAVLFGDGAGGVLVKKDALEPRFLASQLRSYGHLAKFLSAGQTSLLPFPGPVTGLAPFKMEGREVYKFATHKVPEVITACLEEAGVDLAEVDLFLLHQANYRIIKQVAKRLDLPEEKFPCNIAEYGNTSAASEAILLSELVEDGKAKAGDLVVLAGFGGGLTAAAQLVRL